MDEIIERLRAKAASEGKTISQLFQETLSNCGVKHVAAKSDTCSFCGKGKSEVRKLITGPNACICDQCVKICMVIVEDV